jgi:hypothetical protein
MGRNQDVLLYMMQRAISQEMAQSLIPEITGRTLLSQEGVVACRYAYVSTLRASKT